MSVVIREQRGSVALLTLNRPDKLNTLTIELVQRLQQELQAAGSDPEVRVIILTGAGRAFCAGADLDGRLAELQSPVVAPEDALAQGILAVARTIENLPRPVIAALNGHALGGGLEVALACDLRYAAGGIKLGLPESRIGSLPGGGGTQRLPRIVGPAVAKEIMFTADHISADEACRIGLVNRVFPKEELMERVMEVANVVASRGPLSVQLIKQAVNVGIQADIQTGLALEQAAMVRLRQSEDRKEGIQAFLEKRAPAFTGR